MPIYCVVEDKPAAMLMLALFDTVIVPYHLASEIAALPDFIGHLWGLGVTENCKRDYCCKEELMLIEVM